MKKLIAALLHVVASADGSMAGVQACECMWRAARMQQAGHMKLWLREAVAMPKPSFPSHLAMIQVHTNDRAVCGGSGTVVATCATKRGLSKMW